MNILSKYLLSLVMAAVICVLIRHLAGANSFAGKMLQLLCGVFMAVTMLSPVADIPFGKLSGEMESYRQMADAAVADGVRMAEDAQKQYISEQTAAYILDEAADMGLAIGVEVMLSEESPYIPQQVTLTGNASPYEKQRLGTYILEKFDISKENQIWK